MTTPTAPAPARTLLDVLRGRPGWPLVALFVGYPLWWVLGVADVVTLVITAVMAVELARTRCIRVPRNFGVLVVFLVWVLLSAALVQVDAPGAEAGGSTTRYLTWAWRFLWYLKATIVALYVLNERDRLSLSWLYRVFGRMFLVVVAGGLLGVLAPHFQFPSVVELVLPKGLTSNTFVHSLVHPVASENFTLLGGSEGRTSAPFAYSNVWGLNFACFLPFWIVAWFGRDAGWRRTFAPFVLLVAAVPVVFSLNRALWLALVVATVFVVLRAAIAGRARAVAGIAAGALVLIALLTVSPLGSTTIARLQGNGATSDVGRQQLASLSLKAVEQTSPLLGFGTTRAVQGNFASIAGGATVSCPRCVLPSLGTQGQWSLVTFTQGLIGALLYFGFLALQFLRHIRLKSGYAIAALSVLLIHLVTSPVYSADNLSLLAIFAAVGVLNRARVEESASYSPSVPYAPDEPTLSAYVDRLVLQRVSLVVLLAAGAIGGGLVAVANGPSYAAGASLYLPDDPTLPGGAQYSSSLDSIAALATSTATVNAVRAAPGTGGAMDTQRLTVTATPNSRILHVRYTARSAATARAVVDATTRAVLAQRRTALQQAQAARAAELTAGANAISSALQTVAVSGGPSVALTAVTDDLVAQAREIDAQLARVEQTPVDPGSLTSPVTSRAVHDRGRVDIANGVGLGLLAWVALSLVRGAFGLRIRSRRDTTTIEGCRVLATGRAEDIDIVSLAGLSQPTVCLPVGRRSAASAAAAGFEATLREQGAIRSPVRALLVAANGDSRRDVALARARLERAGVEVLGIIVIGPAAPNKLRRLLPGGAAHPRDTAYSSAMVGPDRQWDPPELMRRWWLPAAALTVAAVLLTAGYAHTRPDRYAATVRVQLDALPGLPLATNLVTSSQQVALAMQSEAALATSPALVSAVESALGRTASAGDQPVVATVVPNSTVLSLRVIGSAPARAARAASAAANELLTLRADQGDAAISAQIRSLEAEASITTLSLRAAQNELQRSPPPPNAYAQVAIDASRLAKLQQSIGQLRAVPIAPGSVLDQPDVRAASTRAAVVRYLLFAAAAVLAALALLTIWHVRYDRTVRAGGLLALAGLPVLSVVPLAGGSSDGGAVVGRGNAHRAFRLGAAALLARTAELVRPIKRGAHARTEAEGGIPDAPTVAVCPVDRHAPAATVAAGLTDALRTAGVALTVTGTPPANTAAGIAAALRSDVVVFAAVDGRTRRADVVAAAEAATRLRIDVAGIVITSGTTRRRPISSATDVATPALDSVDSAAATAVDVGVGHRDSART